MSARNLEEEVCELDYKTKTVSQLINVLKESLSFCEDEIAAMKLNVDEIKGECCSNTDKLRKQIWY